jgi:hypothetical protein
MRRAVFQRFQPSQVSGCRLWLDGSNPLWAKDNTRPSNGTALSAWTDQSGQGNNAAQGTGANQPVFNTSGINGMQTVTSTAAKGMPFGTTGFPSGSGARTVFVILKTSNGATFQYLFGYGTVAAAQYFAPYIGTLSGGFSFGIDIAGRHTFGNTVISSGTPYCAIATYTSSTINTTAMIVNGTAQTNTSGSDGTPNTVLGGFANALTCETVGANGFIGEIGEILIYNKALSTTEASLVRTYLSNKWRLTA